MGCFLKGRGESGKKGGEGRGGEEGEEGEEGEGGRVVGVRRGRVVGVGPVVWWIVRGSEERKF